MLLFLKKLLKIVSVATALGVFCFIGTGCTSSGEHLANYRDLSIRTTFSDTFRLEPVFEESANIYIVVRDLSGHSLNDAAQYSISKAIVTNTNYTLVNDANQAEVIVYATVSDIYSNSKQSNAGVPVGAVAGFTTGAIIADSSHHYGPENTLTALLFGLLGAGIGYAIDDSLSLDTLVLTTNLEVRQLYEGNGYIMILS